MGLIVLAVFAVVLGLPAGSVIYVPTEGGIPLARPPSGGIR